MAQSSNIILLALFVVLALAASTVLIAGGACVDASGQGWRKAGAVLNTVRAVQTHAARPGLSSTEAAANAAWSAVSFHSRYVHAADLLKCVMTDRKFDVDKDGAMQPFHCGRLKRPKELSPTAWGILQQTSQIELQLQGCRDILENEIGMSEESTAVKSMQPHMLQLRPVTSDFSVFMQVFCENTAWHFLLDILPYVPFERPVQVLDAGANIGLASLMMAAFIHYDGTITAVEANPPTFEVMRNNLPADSVYKPVLAALVPDPQAQSGKTVKFGVNKGESWWAARIQTTPPVSGSRRKLLAPVSYGGRNGLLPPGETEKRQEEVETVSMTQLAAKTPGNRFDFIKLDIEGYELHVLKDPASRKVMCDAICIFAELHDWMRLPGFEAGSILEAWEDFTKNGCPEGRAFAPLRKLGEHMIVCREDF